MRLLRTGKRMVVTISAVMSVAAGVLLFAQPGQAGRPALLFKEDWKVPKHEGAATDEIRGSRRMS